MLIDNDIYKTEEEFLRKNRMMVIVQAVLTYQIILSNRMYNR